MSCLTLAAYAASHAGTGMPSMPSAQVFAHFNFFLSCTVRLSSPDSHTKHCHAVSYAGVKQFLETRAQFEFPELAQVIHALQRLVGEPMDVGAPGQVS